MSVQAISRASCETCQPAGGEAMTHSTWCATTEPAGPWVGSRTIDGKLVYFAGTACYYEGRCVCADEPATTAEAAQEMERVR